MVLFLGGNELIGRKSRREHAVMLPRLESAKELPCLGRESPDVPSQKS